MTRANTEQAKFVPWFATAGAACSIVPIARFYTPVYVRTSIFGSFSRTHRSQYRMLFLTGRAMKPSPVMNDDVVRGKTVEPERRIIPLALS